MRDIVVIAHNIRSAHNVGSLLRTADGLGVSGVYLTGYTPYPRMSGDDRLPHIASKVHESICKTALGAEQTIKWHRSSDVENILDSLSASGYKLIALEQTMSAVPLNGYKAPEKVAMLLGSEVTGIAAELLEKIETHIYIPMYGKKESFNVIQAAAMAMYDLRVRV